MAVSVQRGSTKIIHVLLHSRGCSVRLRVAAAGFPLPADAWSLPHRGGSHVPVLLLLTSVLLFPSEPASFHFCTRPAIRKLSLGLLQFAFCQICLLNHPPHHPGPERPTCSGPNCPQRGLWTPSTPPRSQQQRLFIRGPG